MWLVSKLEVVPRTYSFESSGQGKHRDEALAADGEVLINMGHFVDWDEEPVQLLVCEACGTIGCESGNYLAVRRLGDFVALVPSLDAYRAGESEHAAPYFVRKKGAPLIRGDAWAGIRAAGFPLPAPDSIRQLRWDEAWLAAQFDAPYQLLGQPGQEAAVPLSSKVVATIPWMDPVEVTRLGTFAGWSASADARVTLVSADKTQIVSLLLDDPPAEIPLFAKVGWADGLLIQPGLMMTPEKVPQP